MLQTKSLFVPEKCELNLNSMMNIKTDYLKLFSPYGSVKCVHNSGIIGQVLLVVVQQVTPHSPWQSTLLDVSTGVQQHMVC